MGLNATQPNCSHMLLLYVWTSNIMHNKCKPIYTAATKTRFHPLLWIPTGASLKSQQRPERQNSELSARRKNTAPPTPSRTRTYIHIITDTVLRRKAGAKVSALWPGKLNYTLNNTIKTGDEEIGKSSVAGWLYKQKRSFLISMQNRARHFSHLSVPVRRYCIRWKVGLEITWLFFAQCVLLSTHEKSPDLGNSGVRWKPNRWKAMYVHQPTPSSWKQSALTCSCASTVLLSVAVSGYSCACICFRLTMHWTPMVPVTF
jgi:hypothetical protein